MKACLYNTSPDWVEFPRGQGAEGPALLREERVPLAH